MAKTLKGALVGFGQVAEKAHAPGFAASGGFEIVAVAEASDARRQAAQAALPAARLYHSLEALLEAERDLDFVDLATPPHMHAAQALASLKAGRHVLCEKPLALELGHFADLKAAAQSADRAVFTVHNWAYSPQWRGVERRLPLIGPLRHVSLLACRTKAASSAVPGDWRKDAAQSGGGILVDHGWHNLYLIYRLFKAQPTRVTARLSEGSGVEEEACVLLEFPSAAATLYLTWRAGDRANWAAIVGEKGLLSLSDDSIGLQRAGHAAELESFPQKLSAGSAHPDWFASMLPDFRAAVEDRAQRAANVEEADFCLKMIRRVYHSVRIGRNPLRDSPGRPGETRVKAR